MAITTYLPIITLSINGLNVPVRRQKDKGAVVHIYDGILAIKRWKHHHL